jgi:hypothetical protein
MIAGMLMMLLQADDSARTDESLTLDTKRIAIRAASDGFTVQRE